MESESLAFKPTRIYHAWRRAQKCPQCASPMTSSVTLNILHFLNPWNLLTYCRVSGTWISTCPTSQLRKLESYSSSTTSQTTKFRPSRINMPHGPRNFRLEHTESIRQCTVMSLRHISVSASQIFSIWIFKMWTQNLSWSPQFCILNSESELHAYFHVDVSFLGILIILANRDVRKLFY